MKNYTLNDRTQLAIIPHLLITEELLATIASNHTAKISAMPDLGIAHNGTRMCGGFFTGSICTWQSEIPLIPIDATVNVCGTCLYKLKHEISIEKFTNSVNEVLSDTSKYTWNYNNGNHFITLLYSDGKLDIEEGFYMLVHASANEYKYDPDEGLYPTSNVWYSPYIQTIQKDNRYLRYISGKHAERFYSIAHKLLGFNENRNDFFIESVLKNNIDYKSLSIQHYGMPDPQTICIGAHWENKPYTLLTAPGKPIYIVNPIDEFHGSPHGFGLELKHPEIDYTNNGISICGKEFLKGQNISIGNDAVNRCTTNNTDIDTHVSKILSVCPGNVIGKLEQIVSFSKDGWITWKN